MPTEFNLIFGNLFLKASQITVQIAYRVRRVDRYLSFFFRRLDNFLPAWLRGNRRASNCESLYADKNGDEPTMSQSHNAFIDSAERIPRSSFE